MKSNYLLKLILLMSTAFTLIYLFAPEEKFYIILLGLFVFILISVYFKRLLLEKKNTDESDNKNNSVSEDLSDTCE